MARTGQQTRDLLTDTALRLFRERGFDATTMRLIAAEAGVSLGNAYHYFDGKDAFVQELYRQIQVEHRALAQPRIVAGASLADNLSTVLHTGIDVAGPYHGFGQGFLRMALPADSAASPFSDDSSSPRAQAISLMELTIEQSSMKKIPPRLAERLPQLLWLTQLAVTLHWVTDSTPEQQRTRILIDGIVPIVATVVSMARLPIARGLVADAVKLLDDLTSDSTLQENS